MTDQYVDHGSRYVYWVHYNLIPRLPCYIPTVGRIERRIRTLNGGDSGRHFVWEDECGKVYQRAWVKAGCSGLFDTPAPGPMTYEEPSP